MKVKVRLFAMAKQIVGQPTIEVELAQGARVSDLKQAIAEQAPELAAILPVSLIALNSRYAVDLDLINETTEIALIPPVSGGSAATV